MGAAPHDIWPLSGEYYSCDAAVRSMQTTFDQFRCADEFGFDWVTVAEHHYSGFSLTPNPMVMAGALSQLVRRAKIAVLGPTLPILNPVRVAEEFAMLDTMSGGRLVAGMMRGTPNEYVTYNINPAESRERFAEAGEFAAKNHIGIGFAFTTVPLAKSAVQHYRACARDMGWEPAAEDVIYRAMFHVADTDDEAFADMSTLPPRISLVDQNRAIAEGVLQSGYYGADAAAQRQRTSRRELADRIELGQVIVGGPDTVLAQVRRIRDELGAGVLDLVVGAQLGERTLHSIELFGAKVLPRMREL